MGLGFNNVIYPDIPYVGGTLRFTPIQSLLSPLIFQIGLYAEGIRRKKIPIIIDPNTISLKSKNPLNE